MRCFWSGKGGSGASVVAAAVALSSDSETLLVDLCGDQPAILAQPDAELGITDWLDAGVDAAPDALHRLETAVTPKLSLLRFGTNSHVATERVELLVSLLAQDQRNVVVDAGADASELSTLLCEAASESFLVLRPCYLALRRAKQHPRRATAVVLVNEPGRTLRAKDVSAVLGLPVRVVVEWDTAVARAVDAGLLATRLPRSLAKPLATL
jgi:Flp pilus assembly CpaE family ATPase